MIRIDVDDRRVVEALNELIQRGHNPRPALQEIGEYLITSTKQRFRDRKAPDGTPWAPNAPLTIARKGNRDEPLIGETGRLRNEIRYRVSGSGIEWGSNLAYAAMQQFGGQKENYPHLRGDIPARPFLGLSEEDETTALEIVNDWLAEAL